ncbi:MAG: HAD family hydrolase [Lachnospiraceae bacterium]|nr:HAD family hydrolase [Lachnospiraceae bacterium]
MKRMKLFIWDFDGTLLDTYPFITGACNGHFQTVGIGSPKQKS